MIPSLYWRSSGGSELLADHQNDWFQMFNCYWPIFISFRSFWLNIFHSLLVHNFMIRSLAHYWTYTPPDIQLHECFELQSTWFSRFKFVLSCHAYGALREISWSQTDSEKFLSAEGCFKQHGRCWQLFTIFIEDIKLPSVRISCDGEKLSWGKVQTSTGCRGAQKCHESKTECSLQYEFKI